MSLQERAAARRAAKTPPTKGVRLSDGHHAKLDRWATYLGNTKQGLVEDLIDEMDEMFKEGVDE